jgi:hypothetical protein
MTNRNIIYGVACVVLVGLLLIGCGKKQAETAWTPTETVKAATDAAQAATDAAQAVTEAAQTATEKAQTATDAVKAVTEAAQAAAAVAAVAGNSSTSSSTGDRKAIDDFFKSYEEFITKAEKAKSGNDIMAMASLATQSADLSAKVSALQTNSAWTAADMTKYTTLSLRAVKALQ